MPPPAWFKWNSRAEYFSLQPAGKKLDNTIKATSREVLLKNDPSIQGGGTLRSMLHFLHAENNNQITRDFGRQSSLFLRNILSSAAHFFATSDKNLPIDNLPLQVLL